MKLKDVDSTQLGAEYINANYIRQPTESEQNDMNSSSENLAQQQQHNNNSTNTPANNAITYASINQQQQQQPTKNCQSCQLLNKPCSQCSMKANEVGSDPSVECLMGVGKSRKYNIEM